MQKVIEKWKKKEKKKKRKKPTKLKSQRTS